MKYINTRIKTVVLFNEDGKIKPVMFIYNNVKYHIKKIVKTWGSYNYDQGGTTNYQLQVVPFNNTADEKICEIKFLQSDNIWILVKI